MNDYKKCDPTLPHPASSGEISRFIDANYEWQTILHNRLCDLEDLLTPILGVYPPEECGNDLKKIQPETFIGERIFGLGEGLEVMIRKVSTLKDRIKL